MSRASWVWGLRGVSLALFSVLLIAFVSPLSANDQFRSQKPDWLEGSGKDLRIKLTGKVLDDRGETAKGCQLIVWLKTPSGERSLPAVMEGNRFKLCVPVGDAGWWFTLHVNATSADGGQIVREMIRSDTIRQAAIDGVTLRMKKPERFVEVTVVDNGKTVPDAFVTAEIEGKYLADKTNAAGVATFPMMNRDSLSQLTAWTEDFKIGGYSFDRDPPRDPLGDKYTIELEKSRSQTIRILNEEDQTPIANLDFLLIVGTGEPDYQYLGRTPDCEMRTDKNGEAVYRRFPDWKKHGSYIEVRDPHWFKSAVEPMVDGKMVVKLRKSQFDKRKHVIGTVTSTDGNVAGFAVSIRSFQGEEKNHSDVLSAFTDEHGNFAADYLPGATYCICVDDARFVSNIIDVVPYEPMTKKTIAPSLKISQGQPVEIVATMGPERRPLAHQCINLTTIHEFPFRENGMTHHGIGGRTWQVFTDEQGKVTTLALPGNKLRGSLYSPQWRVQETVTVKPEGVTRLEFHRQVADKRNITGQLILDQVEADLQDAIIEIGSIDGETNERLTLKANADGKFSFESQASKIGIYAHTKDGKAAVVSILDRFEGPIELRLKPLGEYCGQLLGKEDHPLQGHAVRASLYVSGKRNYSKPNPTGFSAATFETKTDDQGKYTLKGLPCEVALDLFADSLDGSKQGRHLDKFYLVPHESRPVAISRFESKPAAKTSFAERYAKTLRDCRISHFHGMIILFQPSDDAKRFVDANLLDYEKTEEVASFMQLQGQIADEPANAEILEFAKSKGWPVPEKGKICACALDAAGKELGRIEFDPKDPGSAKAAANFIRQHALPKEDAISKWDEAFATAKQTHRKVWVRISQRYCGPCFMLARWLDDHKELLDKDYVFVKIDDWRDLHGAEVAKRLTGDDPYGIPFHAIFDPDGHMLMTSDSPMGNIGFPSGFEGKKHLQKMLMDTRSTLTDKQLDEIVASLSD